MLIRGRAGTRSKDGLAPDSRSLPSFHSRDIRQLPGHGCCFTPGPPFSLAIPLPLLPTYAGAYGSHPGATRLSAFLNMKNTLIPNIRHSAG